MSFIIDIFENLLQYNNINVFIILDINNEIWFKMKDLLKLLGYSSLKKMIFKFNIDTKYKKKYKYIKVYPSRDTPANNQPNTIFINEPGLYQLLSNSKKTIAINFKNELFSNILPTIRKTGIYKVKEYENNKLKKLNEKLITKISKVEEENNYYEDKHIYKSTYNSYIYIIKKNIGKKKCYKIGYTDDIKKRMLAYKTAKTGIKIIYYISIIYDGKQMEECIKSVTKLHKLKQKTDDLCFLSLKQLKGCIKDCLDIFKNHICKCTICKKKIKLNNIDTHFCNI